MKSGSDVYSYFAYVWFVNKCFGLSNRSLKPTSNLIFSIKNYLYNGIVFAIAITFVHHKFKMTKIQNNMKLLPQYTDILLMTSIFCGAIVDVTVNLFHQCGIQGILKEIWSMEQKLTSYGHRTSYKKIKRQTIILLGFTGIFWIIHFTYYNFFSNEIRDFTFWTCTYVPFIVTSIYTIQFIAFCFIIETLYETFNNLLNNVLTILSKKSQNNNDSSLQIHLNEIQLFHNKLYRLVVAINNVHSLPLLVNFAVHFVFMFACSYFCLFGYMYRNRYIKPQTISDYLVPIIPCIPVFIQFFLIIWSSEFVSKQRIKTEQTISNLSMINKHNSSTWVRCIKYYHIVM